ncbi:hypothetical protein [Brucella cytisi]|uniref:Uncharacterized protein n=1 Tax=Brucella cytisi TaxID=407152 RepID=A0A1J6I010_9HYPH|nr:hypothetical protein [Brucella cytisi]OIS92210.1 hypothetical protein BLA27_17035 [Brucella cytisi]
MPFFNEASRIYTLEEVNFMRRCYSNAAATLEEDELDYAAVDLSSTILMLYESGLRDLSYITELAVRLAHQKYQFRHPNDSFPAANSNMEAANKD